MLDSKGNFAIQSTFEIGGGVGKSGGIFANAVYSTVDSVESLEGAGIASSGSAGPVSGSYGGPTPPLGAPAPEQSLGRTYELGVTASLPGSTAEGGGTITITTTHFQTDILGKIGSSIGSAVYEILHGDEDNRLATGDPEIDRN